MKNLICNDDLRDQILSAESHIHDIQKEDALIGDWICKFAPIIITALKIALWFVGRREKEIIKAVIEGLQNQCDLEY